MTSRELIRWSRLHERRAHAWWTSPWLVAVVAGGGLAALARYSPGTWLAGTLVAFAVAFLRVPFHLYWRADAPVLAQLPIDGSALLDAALVRCARGAAATVVVALIGALPTGALYMDHAELAVALGLCAAFVIPAVAIGAAMLVAIDPARFEAVAGSSPPASSGAVLGALPGFAASAVIVVALVGGDVGLVGLAAISVVALIVTRVAAPRAMGRILRDVSALDRQRLATLEVRPPTTIERAVAALLGAAALPYRKDARLMRRRYPMAFALGALAFLVLAIVGLASPRDPTPWLVATLGAAAVYAIALADRLRRPPIELPRLSATLPIADGARRRAKLAWLTAWVALFVVIPAIFAIVRTR